MPDGANVHEMSRRARTPLCDLAFNEVLFTQEFRSAQMRRTEGGRGELTSFPAELSEALQDLAAAVATAFDRDPAEPGDDPAPNGAPTESTAVRIIEHEELRLKATRIATIGGELYHCRRMRQPMPGFGQLAGIPEAVRKHMLGMGRTRETGLVLFAGLPGSGKTTTMLSFLAHMARIWGDLAVLVEQAPEFKMNGIVKESKGRIIQIALGDDQGTAPADSARRLRGLLALGPRYAAVGQASTAAEARLAVDLAVAGVLTFVTVDAIDIVSAISNLINKASEAMTTEAVRDAVALSLRGCVHQSLGDPSDPRDRTMRAVQASTLFLPAPGSGSSIAGRIKTDQLAMLGGEITRQESRIAAGLAPLEPNGQR